MLRLILLSGLLATSIQAYAKELKILTGAGMTVPVKALAADYGKRTHIKVTVVSDTASGVQKRIEADEKFDLVIGTQQVMDRLTLEGKIALEHADLARMVAGIGAKAGTAKPAIATTDQFKATLLAAKSITYVDPASGGITGVFFLSHADRIGISRQVRAKAVLKPNGQGVAAAVANGQAQYGVTLISEMLPNKKVTVWPLPAELQMTTIYAGAVSTHAQNAMDATKMLADLAGEKGRDASLKAGLIPLTDKH
jgi:molybdate transport system substrate-binding protein